jgi:hypothetical protein
VKLGKLRDGRFYRNVGYLESGAQPKFMLGRLPAEALVRAGRIEQLWKLVVADAERSEATRNPAEDSEPFRPVWFGFALEAARAIADGRSLPAFPEGWAARLYEIGLVPTDPNAVAKSKVQTFHQAVDAYVASLATSHPTVWGGMKARLIKFITEYEPDFTLASLDTPKIDSVLRLHARRPVSRHTGGPVSEKWARNCIKEFKAFLRWLHRSREWSWRFPDDYEHHQPVKVVRTQQDRAKITSLAVSVFSVDELRVLWKYALPWERLCVALALNCGFGMAEIGTLQRAELHLGEIHPHAHQIGVAAEPGDWIMRLRGKTDVYGEWRLWPVTVAALRWITTLRPHATRVVTPKGGGELHPVGQRNNQIANAWNRLLDRVGKDHPEFRRLSFGKLRKTAINLVRQASGEEIAALFASHGQPVFDDLMSVYANPRWAALHRTTEAVGGSLASVVFAGVPEPFAQRENRGGPNISLGVRDRILEGLAAGKRVNVVAAEAGVSRETVRRWRDRAKVS